MHSIYCWETFFLQRSFWWINTLCYGISFDPPKRNISLPAVYILWLFWLWAGVFHPTCKPLRVTSIEKKKSTPKTTTKIISWNCSRVLYIAFILCYRVNLRNLWQEVGQISCLCAVSGNKPNSNEVKREENKQIDKQMLQC